jgi:hypothetical protein
MNGCHFAEGVFIVLSFKVNGNGSNQPGLA